MTDTNQQKTKIWNVPNILTCLRMVMIIPFVIFILGSNNGWFAMDPFVGGIVAAGIFLLASLTDLLDGKIARKYNLVTNFGKFMDPLADKILVCAGLVCLVDAGKIPAWIVIVILAREFIISGFRLVASDAGIVIAASYWGKWKTTFQMALVILALVDLSAYVSFYGIIVTVVMYIALALTVVSLIDYIAKNHKVLTR